MIYCLTFVRTNKYNEPNELVDRIIRKLKPLSDGGLYEKG